MVLQHAHPVGHPCWVKIEQRAIVPAQVPVLSMMQELPVAVQHVISPVMQDGRYSQRPASIALSVAASVAPSVVPSVGTAEPSPDAASAMRPVESKPIRPHAPAALIALATPMPNRHPITMRASR